MSKSEMKWLSAYESGRLCTVPTWNAEKWNVYASWIASDNHHYDLYGRGLQADVVHVDLREKFQQAATSGRRGFREAWGDYCDVISDKRVELPPVIEVTHVVAKQVKEEISRLIQDDIKGNDARRARSSISAIFSAPNHIEIDLSDYDPAQPEEKVLGPDSDVDRRLLAAARSALESGVTDIVYLATHDGGIKVEASIWHTKLDLEIFTPSNRDELKRKLDGRELQQIVAAEESHIANILAKKEQLLADLEERRQRLQAHRDAWVRYVEFWRFWGPVYDFFHDVAHVTAFIVGVISLVLVLPNDFSNIFAYILVALPALVSWVLGIIKRRIPRV